MRGLRRSGFLTFGACRLGNSLSSAIFASVCSSTGFSAFTFVVNTGNSLSRWTNGRFLSTKHHVINSTGEGRYSIPTFFGANLDAEIRCVPTCDTPEHPAEFPPITYRDLQNWYFLGDGVAEKSMGPGTKSEGKWMRESAQKPS